MTPDGHLINNGTLRENIVLIDLSATFERSQTSDGRKPPMQAGPERKPKRPEQQLPRVATVLRLTVGTRKLPVMVRYAATTALVIAALGARWLLLGPEPGWAFAIFYPVVVFAGIAFDRGTGLFATALSALLGGYCFLAAYGHGSVVNERDIVGLLIFLGTAGLIALLAEGMHFAFAQLQSANAQLAQAEDQTLVLLHETIHRFRNDLQRLNSTIALQAMASKDSAVKAALGDVQTRVQALAAIKARLDVALIREGSTSLVESRAFLSGLVADWATATKGQSVSFRVEAEAHPLPATRAVSLGLILHELLTNTMKYAFPDNRGGSVGVIFRQEGDQYRLLVEDDGVGYDTKASPKGTGLGRRIIGGLAAQMGGQLDIVPRSGGGTICSLRVPACPAT